MQPNTGLQHLEDRQLFAADLVTHNNFAFVTTPQELFLAGGPDLEGMYLDTTPDNDSEPLTELEYNTEIFMYGLEGLYNIGFSGGDITGDLNGDATTDIDDAEYLTSQTTSLIQNYYNPFDIDVYESTSTGVENLPSIFNSLISNTTQNDHHVLIGGIALAHETTTPGVYDIVGINSVIRDDAQGNGGIFGQAFNVDNNGNQQGNYYDEMSFVSIPNIIDQAKEDSQFTNGNWTNFLGKVAVHESGHGFGLSHTYRYFVDPSNNNESFTIDAGTSDIMLAGSDAYGTYYNDDSFFTRFDLVSYDVISDSLVASNNYEQLANDSNIGVASNNSEFVTGTGGDDTIWITESGTAGTYDVDVTTYYTDSYGVTQSLSDSYTISNFDELTIKTGQGDDFIYLAASLLDNADITVDAGDDGYNTLTIVGTTGVENIDISDDSISTNATYNLTYDDTITKVRYNSGGGVDIVDITDVNDDTLIVINDQSANENEAVVRVYGSTGADNANIYGNDIGGNARIDIGDGQIYFSEDLDFRYYTNGGDDIVSVYNLQGDNQFKAIATGTGTPTVRLFGSNGTDEVRLYGGDVDLARAQMGDANFRFTKDVLLKYYTNGGSDDVIVKNIQSDTDFFINVNGGSSNVALTLHGTDDDDIAQLHGNGTGNHIFKMGTGRVRFDSDVSTVDYWSKDGDDDLKVSGTASSGQWWIHAGDGNDRIWGNSSGFPNYPDFKYTNVEDDDDLITA